MEVHAHTHTERKKWFHYLWEFLMLFLAVFCGFLAENFRELQVEHHREKQYMESMLEDLASDTANLSSNIIRSTTMEKGFDSLENYLYDIENIVENTSAIYRQNATYTRNVLLSLSDQTATQLRNSGNMRLIRKRNVSNAISSYWRSSNNMETTANNFNTFIAEKSKSEDLIFNRRFYSKAFNNDPSTTLDVYSNNKQARLMTTDKDMLISYANYTDRLQKFLERYITPQLDRLRSRATYLIILIKKEYQLQ